MTRLPFERLNVYHGFKFPLEDVGDDRKEGDEERDWVRARPGARGQTERFDTVVAMVAPQSESTGVEGTRIGRLKVIFRLPDLLYGLHEAPATWPREPLAYIEWYSKLKGESEPDHNMYSVVSSKRRREGLPYADFVPLSSIRQSCQLIPAFGTGDVPQEWTGKNVLDVFPALRFGHLANDGNGFDRGLTAAGNDMGDIMSETMHSRTDS
ncbi:hypothetical protein M405DRAFT_867713 [Rhizopogon salebrosus TDB-379]|nr:hypothetical protein M405DRAFT_867713 [Rhizopogon salebrosus TDB-379]